MVLWRRDGGFHPGTVQCNVMKHRHPSGDTVVTGNTERRHPAAIEPKAQENENGEREEGERAKARWEEGRHKKIGRDQGSWAKGYSSQEETARHIHGPAGQPDACTSSQ